MKKVAIYWIAQAVMVLIMATLAGLTALMTMATVGGMALGLAPEAHFKLASGLICPEGGEVSLEEGGQAVNNSDGAPTHVTSVYCTDAEGVRHELSSEEGVAGLLAASGAILGAYFVGGFVVMFVPAVIIGGLLVHVIVNSVMKRRAAQPAGMTI